MKTQDIRGLFTRFEAAATIVETVECWSARQLQELLGYSKWQNFAVILDRAKEACQGVGGTCSGSFYRRQ
jgi:DNA-damage-inducible protein D